MLMWQLASGWVPQQAEGPLQMQAEVSLCADMLDTYGAAFPGAADAVAAGDFGWPASWCSSSSSSSTGDGAAAGWQDFRHGCLPAAADHGWLPEGYRALMYRCCRPQASIRPSLSVALRSLNLD